MNRNKDISAPRDFINAQRRGRQSIIDVFREKSIYYQEGLAYLDENSNDISSAVEQLRDIGVFDYDGYSNLLYFSEDYEGMLRIRTDTNIADIKKKQNNIVSLISHIKSRKEKNEDYTSEIKAINKNLMNIQKVLILNLQILNDSQLKFKGETNLEIKKNSLNECKEELESLSIALDILDKFLIERKGYLNVELGNDSIKYSVNLLIAEIRNIRGNLIRILMELTKYLIQIEKEMEKIKHINRLYKLKHSGDIYERTNIKEVFNRTKKVSKKIRLHHLYYNDLDLVDTLVVEYKEQNKVIRIEIPKDERIPVKVKSAKDREPIKRVTIGSKAAYLKFVKQDLDLASYLETLEINRKKFISLFIRIILNHNLTLEVNRKENLSINGYIVPTVNKKV